MKVECSSLNQGLSLRVASLGRQKLKSLTHHSLRLIRYRMGSWTLDGLAPGEWRMITL